MKIRNKNWFALILVFIIIINSILFVSAESTRVYFSVQFHDDNLNGECVTASVKAVSLEKSDTDVTVYMVRYNKDCEVTDKILHSDTVPAEKTLEFDISIDVSNAEEGDTVKLFAWQDGKIVPLTEGYEITKGEILQSDDFENYDTGQKVSDEPLGGVDGNWKVVEVYEKNGDYTPNLGTNLYAEIGEGNNGKAIILYDNADRTQNEDGTGAVMVYRSLPKSNEKYEISFTLSLSDTLNYGGITLSSGMVNTTYDRENPCALQLRFESKENGEKVRIMSYDSIQFNESTWKNYFEDTPLFDTTKPIEFSIVIDPKQKTTLTTITDGVITASKLQYFNVIDSVFDLTESWEEAYIDTIAIHTGIGAKGCIIADDFKIKSDRFKSYGDKGQIISYEDFNQSDMIGKRLQDGEVIDGWHIKAIVEKNQTSYASSLGNKLYAEIADNEGDGKLYVYDNVGRKTDSTNGAGGALIYKSFTPPENDYAIKFSIYAPNDLGSQQYAGISLGSGANEGGDDTENPLALQMVFTPKSDNTLMQFDRYDSIYYKNGSSKAFLASSEKMMQNKVWDFEIIVMPKAKRFNVTVTDGKTTADAVCYYSEDGNIWDEKKVDTIIFNTSAGNNGIMEIDNFRILDLCNESAKSLSGINDLIMLAPTEEGREDYYLYHCKGDNSDTERVRIATGLNQTYYNDSIFIEHPGLADCDGVSIESVTYPGYFLKRGDSDNNIYLVKYKDTDSYRAKTTWYKVPDLLNGKNISYRSYENEEEYLLYKPDKMLSGEPAVFYSKVQSDEDMLHAAWKIKSSEFTGENSVFYSVKGSGIDSVYRFVRQGNGKYLITDKVTKKSITGSSVDFSKSQLFNVISNGNGKYYLKDQNGKYFKDKNAFTIITPDIDEPEFLDGKYYELTHVNSGKLLSCQNNSTKNNTKLTTGSGTGDIVQWGFVKQNGGYTIVNKKSKRAVDIPGASTEDGKNAIIYDANYNSNQVFSAEINSDGSFYLKNKNSSLYLTLKDGIFVQSSTKDAFTAEYKDACGIKKSMAATVTPFVMKNENIVNNVKLQWNDISDANQYDVFRSENGGEFVFINSVEGITVDDYDLKEDTEYCYRVYAKKDTEALNWAQTDCFIPYEKPSMKVSGNLSPSGFSTPSGGLRDKDGVYYKFSRKNRTDGGKGFGTMTVQTSTDGSNYTSSKVILTIEDVLAHETCSEIEDIRFESVNMKYNPKANNFGFIAHAEKGSGGYGFARIFLATYTPGDEKMVFHGCLRPGGDDVRDLNTFIDDDGTGYIMGATHGNADLAIYRLNDDWSAIAKRVALINQGKWRELPNIYKCDGYYYLFTSGCAGWYPTPGMYNVATSMDGPWSELRRAGNTTTFSSQSGYVFSLKTGEDNFIMNSYRWMSNWKDATVKKNQSLRIPVTLSNGYAFYDYFEELQYNWDENRLAPMQRGRIVSQGMPNLRGYNWDVRSNANDGKYLSEWSVDEWPYVWEVDLGQTYSITQAQISWKIHNGAEAYYNYRIEGSIDGSNYVTLCDRTEGYTDYGFTVDNMTGSARYVRLTVERANPRSKKDYEAKLMEVKIIAK